MFETTLRLAFICGLVSTVTCTPQSDPEWDPEPWWNPEPSPGWDPEPSPGWDREPDPEWDPEPNPEGVLGSCFDPGQVFNAQRDRRSGPFSFGSVVTYTCNPGYQGWGSIVCQSNGQWSGPRPTCTAALCQDPGQISNAVREGHSGPYSIGYAVTYRCHAGYTGGGTVICQQNARWTPLPICYRSNNSSTGGSPNQCSDPGQVLNADRDPVSSLSVGTTVQYTCNRGYRGGGSITCVRGGRWTQRPTCHSIMCNAPRIILNGVQTPHFGPYPFGSTLTYVCNIGYALTGARSITCQANGQWSGPPPTCIFNGPYYGCGDPGHGQNAVRFGHSFMFGDVVSYTCNSGYTLNGAGSITCSSSGQWSGPPPTCISTGGGGGCGDPGQVPNAVRSGHSFVYGAVVVYTCDVGYVSGGHITCQANGQWTQRPICLFHGAITGLCEDPGQVLHAERFVHTAAHHDDTFKYMEGTYPPGTTVTYTCRNGYTGSGTITCQADASWTSKPICISPDSGDGTTVLPPQELGLVSADDEDDDTTNILLIIFGTLILLVLIAILILFLLRRRGIHPTQTVTAWWKKKRTGGHGNPPDQQRVESGYQGNPMPITTVAALGGIGAVSNNVYMKTNQGFVNKPSVDAAEVKLSYEALKKKEAQLNKEPLHYENSVSFAALKQKEAQVNDEPPARDSHYEQVQDQKAK